MAKISFYLFEKSPERQVESACRLCRKILRNAAKIWLHCPDPELQQQLDERLWSFDATSFLAHGIDQTHAPICISAQLPTAQAGSSTVEWIVFNFNNQPLEQVTQFGHIIEIVENDESAKQIGREKYKAYRRMGITPQTFKL
ncbi:DNA polymerase III subunit chi [Acinetobacter rongchengensis]|uniref:DNA polymerase III subunit chi n=1 Tax=Acinetobacter rongchengensis TaxID=2419601 RepID=A0A3A8FDQ1_9GAMM|nr:DNA polymerase III subunit chi [Acinetobacter rongchengensis]RKG40524.1 DNA polymerase III subunit chi [Acinetobacter rongchengensis]